jgi:RimJ/RimL family protein N-acetyltransferase
MAEAPRDVVLSGQFVRLEPLALSHVRGLAETTCGDEQVWQWLPTFPADADDMAAVVTAALADQAAGTRFPFAIVHSPTEQVVGSSSYLDIDPADGRIEIGWTWLSRSVWRTAVNTEAKLLLLDHAFGALGCERVALKTHHNNQRSQQAIARPTKKPRDRRRPPPGWGRFARGPCATTCATATARGVTLSTSPSSRRSGRRSATGCRQGSPSADPRRRGRRVVAAGSWRHCPGRSVADTVTTWTLTTWTLTTLTPRPC